MVLMEAPKPDCGLARLPTVALDLRGFGDTDLSRYTYLHALCDSNCLEEAHHHFANSIDSDCIPDQRTCNVIISRLLDSQTPHSTLGVLLVLSPLKPDFVASLVNYSRLMDELCSICSQVRLIKCCLMIGYYEICELGNAQKVFDEMCERGVAPHSIAYSVLVRGVHRKEDIGGAMEVMEKLFERMKCEK